MHCRVVVHVTHHDDVLLRVCSVDAVGQRTYLTAAVLAEDIFCPATGPVAYDYSQLVTGQESLYAQEGTCSAGGVAVFVYVVLVEILGDLECLGIIYKCAVHATAVWPLDMYVAVAAPGHAGLCHKVVHDVVVLNLADTYYACSVRAFVRTQVT